MFDVPEQRAPNQPRVVGPGFIAEIGQNRGNVTDVAMDAARSDPTMAFEPRTELLERVRGCRLAHRLQGFDMTGADEVSEEPADLRPIRLPDYHSSQA